MKNLIGVEIGKNISFINCALIVYFLLFRIYHLKNLRKEFIMSECVFRKIRTLIQYSNFKPIWPAITKFIKIILIFIHII